MSSNKPSMYHIYGRTSYPQPLEYVDKLLAREISELQQNARLHPHEGEWVELVAFPESAIIQVRPRKEA